MPVLTVRISEAEQAQLTRRAKQSGISVIDLLNEVADGVPGPAMEWLRQHPQAQRCGAGGGFWRGIVHEGSPCQRLLNPGISVQR